MIKVCLLIFAISIILAVILYYFFQKKDTFQNLDNKQAIKYNGLVLFDIDGTLTPNSRKHNENVVDVCIKNNWAVGICTAGGIYHMNNLMSYAWMPRNLYDFMREHNDITFNNVSSGFLMGKLNGDAYNNLEDQSLDFIEKFGFRKGFALKHTGKKLGIKDSRRLILCDDLTAFINGVLKYDKNLNTVCAGENCGGNLTVEALQSAMGI